MRRKKKGEIKVWILVFPKRKEKKRKEWEQEKREKGLLLPERKEEETRERFYSYFC